MTDLMVDPDTLDAFMEANPLLPDPACDHCGMDPAAIREAALLEAAAACEYVIKNIDILKADGETYETPRVQKIARGLVDVARQDILALIAKGAAE